MRHLKSRKNRRGCSPGHIERSLKYSKNILPDSNVRAISECAAANVIISEPRVRIDRTSSISRVVILNILYYKNNSK